MAKPLAKLVSMLTPKRTWLQFRLKWLFVLVAVVSMGMAWLVWTREAKRTERAIITELQREGVRFQFDWVPGLKREPPGPAWVRKLLGYDFFAEVTEVEVTLDPRYSPDRGRAQTAAVFRRLADLPNLPSIRLKVHHGPVDEELVHMAQLRKLKALLLTDVWVTDAGLAHLQGLTGLRFVDLRGTQVTDAGLAQLRQALPNCQIFGP